MQLKSVDDIDIKAFLGCSVGIATVDTEMQSCREEVTNYFYNCTKNPTILDC